jgi:hypothetical protein
MRTASKLAAQPRTFKDRDEWVRALLASDLPHAAVRIGISLAFNLHVTTGRLDPTFAALARQSRIPERSIYRLVELLEHAGWIGIQRTGGRSANQYALTNPVTMSGLDKSQPCQNVQSNPDKTSSPTLTNRASNPDKSRIAYRDKRRQAKRQAGQASLTRQPPDDASRDSRKQAAGAKKKPAKPKIDIAAAFEDFWRSYPKRVAKEAGRRAFEKAIVGGVDPAALIAGAKRYAVERHDEDPRFTKHPATWLNAGCWQDESTGAAVIDGDGNVVAFAHPRGTAEPKGMMQTAMELAAELEENPTWRPRSWGRP